MTDNERPTFWQWFDSRKAQAMATDIGKHMAARGFDVTHTGGGCLAWEGPSRDHWQAWITDGDSSLGDDLPDWQAAQTFCAMLCHDDSGEFINGPTDATLEAALAWADKAMKLLPGTRVKLIQNVENYPHILAEPGLCGVLARVEDAGAMVKLDRHFPNLREWDNHLQIDGDSGAYVDYLEPTTEIQTSREPHPLDGMKIHYSGDNEGPALMTLSELIANFDMSGGWYDRMSPEHMRDELDSRGWCEGLHDNGHYLVLNMERLKLCPTPELWDETDARKAAAKPVCEPVDSETDKPACRHRDDGRGRCIDCGAFL
jgi:hypothetical protein